MHFAVAVFHNKDRDIESLMSQYSYEDEDYQEFSIEYSKEDAEKMFSKDKEYDSIDDFMLQVNGCYKDDDGNFGHRSNPFGIYDWYEVGGRWSNYLFPKLSEDKMKKAQDDGMKNKSEFGLKEYMRLKMMTPKEYCLDRQKLGEDTILVKNFDLKSTIEMATHAYKRKELLKEDELFHNVICEDSGLDNSSLGELIEFWKEEGCITIVDCHS